MSALSPRDSFSLFDKQKLLNLSKMYPSDFTHTERELLESELDVYYDIIRHDEKFTSLNGIADLSRLMVETGKHISYRYVYRLLKLALVLPVATATVERCFSAMKLVKSELRNRMGDAFLNDCLIGAIEKEVLLNIKDEALTIGTLLQILMEKYFKRKISSVDGESSSQYNSQPSSTPSMPKNIDVNDLPWDPADRKPILDYNPNQREEIRRLYCQRGPCQPSGYLFPQKTIGDKERRFVSTWYKDYPWLEYSVKANKVYCLCCYLFRDQFGQQAGSDAFLSSGFDSWGKKKRLAIHVGDITSFHHKALKKCEDLMKPKQSIVVLFHRQSERDNEEYRIQLKASLDVVRFLMFKTLPIRGHDESENSIHKGLYLETLRLIENQNEDVRKVLLKAPKNRKLVSPKIQKEIASCFAKEILNFIFDEIGKDVFSLLVDKSSDISKKEQMVAVLRYVDARGLVKERFVGVVHVKETSSLTLKGAIDNLFAEHNVSLKQIRGQGYDGASNMQGEFNGLKALILKDNSSAYYIHCFAHQLQLVVVAIAKHHEGVRNFFDMLGVVINVVCASCKRKDMIRESYKDRIQKEIGKGEIETGTGLHQELSLIRAGDTRWGSHHKTMLGLISLFPEVVQVLEYVKKDGDNPLSRRQASGILSYFNTFDFVFYLHLMLRILGLTNALSQSLQRKDQNIVEAVTLVHGTKRSLQKFREKGFDEILKRAYSFCKQHTLGSLDMDELYIISRNRKTNFTNRHYFKVDIFTTVMDRQIQEFNDRFSEISTELLSNMSALSPRDSFSLFDKQKLLNLSKMYPSDFTHTERELLESELDVYYDIIRHDEKFTSLNGIADLSRLMVETGKHISYRYVYRLLKLALVLPVATATVERCFFCNEACEIRITKSNGHPNGCAWMSRNNKIQEFIEYSQYSSHKFQLVFKASKESKFGVTSMGYKVTANKLESFVRYGVGIVVKTLGMKGRITMVIDIKFIGNGKS
ncbi:uncharacterized protein [Rutidosis leptorrhynchoides]|uniref:uncharacterized protein n=1 Tax=Rutidosis leptorrhynchoides TaxID=125765 RepID=UPI003A993FB0